MSGFQQNCETCKEAGKYDVYTGINTGNRKCFWEIPVVGLKDDTEAIINILK